MIANHLYSIFNWQLVVFGLKKQLNFKVDMNELERPPTSRCEWLRGRRWRERDKRAAGSSWVLDVGGKGTARRQLSCGEHLPREQRHRHVPGSYSSGATWQTEVGILLRGDRKPQAVLIAVSASGRLSRAAISRTTGWRPVNPTTAWLRWRHVLHVFRFPFWVVSPPALLKRTAQRSANQPRILYKETG